MMKGKKKWKGLDLIVYVSNRNEYMCIFIRLTFLSVPGGWQ